MTLDELIASFRSDTDDRATAELFSDEDIVRWLNEGEEEAAVRARLLFEDGRNNDITTIALMKGVSYYEVDPRLYEITGMALHRYPGDRNITYLTPVDRFELDRTNRNWRDGTEQPWTFVQDDRRLVFPGLVDREYTARLEGWRLPLDPMLLADRAQIEPEIGRIHHRFLVYWALHRGYSRPDSEVFNPKRSTIALGMFEAYFGYRPSASSARDSQANRPHANQPVW